MSYLINTNAIDALHQAHEATVALELLVSGYRDQQLPITGNQMATLLGHMRTDLVLACAGVLNAKPLQPQAQHD